MHGHTWKNWKKIVITEEPYKIDEAEREAGRMVYLSADADETLEELEEGTTYIVGGIIDKNRHKVHPTIDLSGHSSSAPPPPPPPFFSRFYPSL